MHSCFLSGRQRIGREVHQFVPYHPHLLYQLYHLTLIQPPPELASTRRALQQMHIPAEREVLRLGDKCPPILRRRLVVPGDEMISRRPAQPVLGLLDHNDPFASVPNWRVRWAAVRIPVTLTRSGSGSGSAGR